MYKPEIMDTTLRDGEQMYGVSYTSEEKIMIAKKLFDLGVKRIEVASALAVHEDRMALEEICKMADVLGRLKDVEVLGLVDENKSVDWIYDSGCRTINLLAKGSREQCSGQLEKDLNQHVEDIRRTVSYAHSKGMDVNVYLEDWSSGMIASEEKNDNYANEMIGLLGEMKVRRIMLADTLGKLSYWKTGEYLRKLKKDFPDVLFDYHAHNDYNMAVANTLEALRAGVSGIHVTVNGLGERAGNCSLFTIAAAAKDLLGIDLGLKENKFIEVSKSVEMASKVRLSPHTPIVGSNFNRQTAGVHAHGNKKNGVYKTKLTGERFGKEKDYEYSLGKHAGRSSVEVNLNDMGLTYDRELLDLLTQKVREIGERKETVTQDDLYFLYIDEVGTSKKRPFIIKDCKSDVSMNGARIGYIKFLLNEEEIENSGIGDGGYDAIMNALKPSLDKLFSEKGIKPPKLIDYEPRIPPGGGTGALVEAVIEWENGHGTFRTMGVDTDQTIAAIKATEKMINLVLMRDK